MDVFFSSNSDDLNADSSQKKDMKFYWQKKIQEVKKKVDTLKPAL